MADYAKETYIVDDENELLTPSLIYYEDLIRQNTEHMIEVAGGPARLWPHIKTHKSLDMTKLLIAYGITRFKTATIAEAEMCAMAGAGEILLAYPLIGPNRERFLRLSAAYPEITFYALEDDPEQIKALALAVEQARDEGTVREDYVLPLMIDVDMGLQRTGAPMEALKDLVRESAKLSGITLEGFHCYDGHRHESDYQVREEKVRKTDALMQQIIDDLREEGYALPVIIAGGTPSFPCHAVLTDWYLSPGTSFIHDFGYDRNFPDLGCIPAAAVATRVVSHPAKNTFTCDCGCKAIATDPQPERGTIAGMPEAKTVMQNEEHWVFRLPEGAKVPDIGEVLYILPTHICPTTALYPEILVASGGKIHGVWPVTARNRKINF